MRRAVTAVLTVMLLLSLDARAAEPAAGTAFVRVSPRDARYFELTDGSAYIPIGLNMIGPGRSGTEDGLRVMDHWMQKLAENGGNYIRVWLSNDFWDIEHQKAGEYDAEKAKRIDAMFELARRHGVRVKCTIEHFREIDPGDVRQRWASKQVHHVSRGGTAATMDEWITNEASRAQFRAKLAWYQKRYGDQPMIYGWELWNEMNAIRGRGDYMGWSAAMLSELKRLFPKNLAMQSLGSFDAAGVRKTYQRLCIMPGNEVAQVHRYLDLGAALEVCQGPVDVLAADSVRELLAMKPNRPVILAESGAVEPRHTGPFKLYANDKAGTILHDVLFAPFFAGAAGPGQCWHWEQYVDRNNLWGVFRGFSEAVRGIDPPAEIFEPLMIEHPRLRVYVLKGKRTTLVWCRDTQNTWKTELQDGLPPEVLKDVAVSLKGLLPAGAMVRAYDPWSNVWSPMTVNSDLVRLPPFSRSIVLRAASR